MHLDIWRRRREGKEEEEEEEEEENGTLDQWNGRGREGITAGYQEKREEGPTNALTNHLAIGKHTCFH